MTRVAAAVLMVASALAMNGAQAQEGVKRTDLQQHDLSIAGREAIQVRVDIAPGVLAPRHTHFGEKIIYVLGGTLLYEVEGKPPVTLKAGDVLFILTGQSTRRRISATSTRRSLPPTSSKRISW